MSLFLMSLRLSIEGLNEIPGEIFEKDYSFISGNTYHQCNAMSAIMMSPRVCESILRDPTNRQFYVENGEHIRQFIDLYCGKEITIKREESEAFLNLGVELGNSFVVTRICDFLGLDIMRRLCIYKAINRSYEEEYQYIVSHFFEMNDEELLSLDRDLLKSVVEDENLVLNNEDSLLLFLLKYFHYHNVYDVEILEKIHFEYLSQQSLSCLFDYYSRHADYASMNSSIYDKLRNRCCSFRWCYPHSSRYRVFRDSLDTVEVIDIKKSVSLSLQRHEVVDFISTNPEFPFKGDRWNGIICYLTKKYGGNVIDLGVVDACCSSNCCNTPKYIADFESKEWFCTNSAPYCIGYDFKNMRIKPTAYTWRSCNGGDNGYHLKSWVIECSLNGSDWKEVDRHMNNNDLNGPSYEKTFTLKVSPICRFIRMKRIENHGYSNTRCAGFEIFGTLFEK